MQKKKKKSSQKSENTDMGCSEYGQKYFVVGMSGEEVGDNSSSISAEEKMT